jgi:hypothetical protein
MINLALKSEDNLNWPLQAGCYYDSLIKAHRGRG